MHTVTRALIVSATLAATFAAGENSLSAQRGGGTAPAGGAPPARGAAPAPGGRGAGAGRGAAAAGPPPIASTQRFTAIGCVSIEPGSAPSAPGFLLTDTRGDKPIVYKLEGKGEGPQGDLAFHVGHSIEVKGTLSVPPAATSPNAPAFLMKLTSLTYLARTCPK